MYTIFFLSVFFAPLPYNEGCAHSFEIMSVWKIMSCASLLLVEANNSSLAALHSNRLPSLPAFETEQNQHY